MAGIDLVVAKQILRDIGKKLTAPHLLIGGLAVNHYIKSRDSHDIDLVCGHNQSQYILQDIFSTTDWRITDRNDDPERPDYEIRHKVHNILVKFGPKILERNEAYKYIDWKHLIDESNSLTYQNEELANIRIPNPAYLAYMKLISFHTRKDLNKKKADFEDFINLTNIDSFSVSQFHSIIEKHNAAAFLKSNAQSLNKYLEAEKGKSIFFNVFDIFSPRREIDDEFDNTEVRKLIDRGGSDFITQMVDAALFFKDATIFAADEISQCIANKKVIPNRLLYKTEPGCKKWLELCNSPDYSFFQRSYKNLNKKSREICDAIVKVANRVDFDLISLGVGDGRKDALLLGELAKRQDNGSYLYYYPMDINITMIERAAQNLSELDEFKNNNNRIKVKPFVGDFFGIDKMDLFYNYRESPNIFSILGNTLGNNDESELIEILKNTITNGDFLIVEVNTNQEEQSIDQLEKNRISREHDLSPLSALGFPVNIDDVKYATIKRGESNKYSIVPNTLTSIGEYTFDKRKVKKFEKPINGKIKLSIVHYYDFEEFKKVLTNELEMIIIYDSNVEGVGIVVLHKNSASTNL